MGITRRRIFRFLTTSMLMSGALLALPVGAQVSPSSPPALLPAQGPATPVSLSPLPAVTLFRLSQGVVRPPYIFAFLEVWRADGTQLAEVRTTHLIALMGTQRLTVQEVRPFQHQSDGVAYILLVDISKSLKTKEFAHMQEVLRSWIDGMGPKDFAAIMTFGTEVRLVHDFSADPLSLKQTIAALKPTDKDTQLHKALVEALEQGRRIDPDLPLRRAIVVLSDGQDDFAGGLTKSEVLERIRIDPVPIYAIGFSSPPKTPQKEEALKVLGEFARSSGGTYLRAAHADFAGPFLAIREIINRVHLATLVCDACTWDGSVRRLQVDLVSGHLGMTTGADLRLHQRERFLFTGEAKTPDPPKAEPAPAPEKPDSRIRVTLRKMPWYGFLGAGVVGLGLLVGLILLLRSREETGPALPPPAMGFPPLSASGSPGASHAPPGETLAFAGGGGAPQPASAGGLPPSPSVAQAGVCRIRLTPLRSDAQAKPFEADLAGPLVIGRSQDKSDLVLAGDQEVSRAHCQLSWEGGRIVLTDLGSKNGTFVNGVPIVGRHQVRHDDVILVGKTELRLTVL